MSLEMEKLLHDTSEFVFNPKLPCRDRADGLIFQTVERGLDMRPVIAHMLEKCDAVQKMQEKLAAQEGHALAMERFIARIEQPRLRAAVTRGNGIVFLPAAAEELEGLQTGDPILIDTQTERIVGRDGQIDLTGDVVEIEARSPQQPNRIVIRYHEQSLVARLHHSLLDDPEALRPGNRVIYDPLRNFVLGPADTRSDGAELLVDLDRLPVVRREQVGAPKPIVDEVLNRVQTYIETPDWAATMGWNPETGYCLTGPTGSGKSYHAALIVTEIHDYIERLTGERTSRVVVCDASQFWNSLFGSTESRISAWAEKVRRLGETKLRTRDGREFVAPIIIVLEEADALLRVRSDGDNSSHLFDRPLAVFLQKVQSTVDTLRTPIVWLTLTNRGDLLDPAAKRRVGPRDVYFCTLSADEAAGVLEVKIPASVPIAHGDGQANGSRDALFAKVLGYLYGPTPQQPVADVLFTSAEKRPLNRCDLVTPAMLEEAISAARDRCLMRSRQAGRLLGLSANDIVQFLHRQFGHLAQTLRPHNVAAHCPEWFAEQSLQIVNVVPLLRRARRPASLGMV